MSHSLHRRGTPESLKNDYILLVTAAKGYNDAENAKEKMRQVLDLMWEIGPANTGSNETGTILSGVSVEEIKEGFTKTPRVRCCFDKKEKMQETLRRLIEMDLGLSVTISGPREDVEEMCHQFGIQPHSDNFSLDIWGKKEQLPDEEILEFITMCGHGMISRQLVEDTIAKVKKGVLTPEQGAVRIGSPCVCGLFNPDRAIKSLQKYVPEKKEGDLE